MDVDLASQLAMASLGAGITPLVRVPGHEHYHASRLLDNGAQGIVAPHVDTVEEAKRIASACRYPPIGHRSLAGALPQLGFRSVPVGEATQIVNAETLVVVMLETPKAIANADAIAQVDGMDVLLIGTNDLCAELGIPGKFTDPKVEEAYRTVDRRLQEARQDPRHGRGLRAQAHGEIHRLRHAHDPLRLRPVVHDGRRARAHRVPPRA